MNEDQIITYIKENNIQKIKFAFADTDGILRGKVIHHKKFIDGMSNGYGFCDVVFGWDTGYPDQQCRIDLSTFRTVPWEDNIPFFLADFSKADGNDLAVDTRSLLKRIAKDCESMGYHPEFSQEFEWFNFRETPQTLAEKSFTNLQTLTPGMFGYSILRTSQNSGFYYDLY